MVLSACSPFFQRIFSENPCKHPVIVLKDFSGWEVQAIVDFMYKGEISVGQEQLQSLIKAAESLQVRGLAQQEHLGVEKESSRNETSTPSASPSDFSFGRFPTPGTTVRTVGERQSPFSPLPGPNYEPPMKLPHMTHPSFTENLMPSRHECSSPIPRRKQARPRRRSGELCGAQDLSSKPPSTSPQPEETAENLCVKKPIKVETPTKLSQELIHNQTSNSQVQSSHSNPMHHESSRPNVKTERSEPSSPPELDLSMPDKEYVPSPPLSLPPVLGLHPDHIDSHSPLPFPPMPSVSALAMTPPQSKCK